MTTSVVDGPLLVRRCDAWGGTEVDVRDVGATDAAVDAAWASVRHELERTERLFDTRRPDSVVSSLRAGGRHEVEPDVAEVVDRCLEARAITRGAFDPWVAPGGFDPRGLATGWVADRCASILRQHGLRTVSVDVGGTLVCRGDVVDAGWPIGVAHPDDALAISAVAHVRDACIATSDVTRGVLNPATRGPATGARQATVIGPDGAIADALATALVVAGLEGASWFAMLPTWSGSVVVGDERTHWGPAFADEPCSCRSSR